MQTRTAAEEQQEDLLDNNNNNTSSEEEREKLEREAELEAAIEHLKSTHQAPSEGQGRYVLNTYNPLDQQYNHFLNFQDKSLKKEYLFACKHSLVKWSTTVGLLLLSLLYYCRMPLHSEVFQRGNEAHVVSLCAVIIGTFVWGLVQWSHVYIQTWGQGAWNQFCSWVICASGTILTQTYPILPYLNFPLLVLLQEADFTTPISPNPSPSTFLYPYSILLLKRS